MYVFWDRVNKSLCCNICRQRVGDFLPAFVHLFKHPTKCNLFLFIRFDVISRSICAINFFRVVENCKNSSATLCVLPELSKRLAGLNDFIFSFLRRVDGVMGAVTAGVRLVDVGAVPLLWPKPPSMLPMLKLFSKSPNSCVMSFLYREIRTHWQSNDIATNHATDSHRFVGMVIPHVWSGFFGSKIVVGKT
jgi:hypothetical protein